MSSLFCLRVFLLRQFKALEIEIVWNLNANVSTQECQEKMKKIYLNTQLMISSQVKTTYTNNDINYISLLNN